MSLALGNLLLNLSSKEGVSGGMLMDLVEDVGRKRDPISREKRSSVEPSAAAMRKPWRKENLSHEDRQRFNFGACATHLGVLQSVSIRKAQQNHTGVQPPTPGRDDSSDASP